MVSWRNCSANRARPSRPIAARFSGSAASVRIAWRKPVQIARLQEDAGLGQHDLSGTVDVVADHGASHQQGLGDHPRQPFAEAGVDDGVDGTEQFGNAVRRHQAREDERAADAAPLEVGDQPVAKDAVADPDEPDLGIGREHVRGDGDDVVVPLELEQPRDRGKGDLVVGEPQLAANVVRANGGDRETRRRPCRCRRSGIARAGRRRRRAPAGSSRRTR